jgi:hypothetical protein
MTFHFCTISTSNHLYKTWSLYDSLSLIHHSICLHVLVIDYNSKIVAPAENILIYNSKHVAISDIATGIIKKYRAKPDKLRWSLKPIFLHYLLKEKKCGNIIYTDNDIAFFNDFSFLFELLNQHPVLLTPHRYPRNPLQNQEWLEVNFTTGLYNAGFFGVNSKAIEILKWWASCCLYRCEKNSWRGLFDDQKYLDLVPIIEPNTLVLQHEGCNIADWNRDICKRTVVNNSILINEKYPVVFIHFNNTTLRTINSGGDPLLNPFFEKYIGLLKKYKSNIDIHNEIKPVSIKEVWMYKFWRLLNAINNKSYSEIRRKQNFV